MARARILFKGKVQGVWFRANCQKKALELGLKGYVKNLVNGDVEVICEGARTTIDELIEWNRNEQPYARVDDLEVEWFSEKDEFHRFSIAR